MDAQDLPRALNYRRSDDRILVDAEVVPPGNAIRIAIAVAATREMRKQCAVIKEILIANTATHVHRLRLGSFCGFLRRTHTLSKAWCGDNPTIVGIRSRDSAGLRELGAEGMDSFISIFSMAGVGNGVF